MLYYLELLYFKAGGKLFKKWHENKKTKEFLEVFSTVAQIRTTELLTIQQCGVPELQGTWCHPQVAIHAAQWISPEFAVQVTKWIYELAVIGQVNLGNEESQEELDSKWKEKAKKFEVELNHKQIIIDNYEEKIQKQEDQIKNLSVSIFFAIKK